MAQDIQSPVRTFSALEQKSRRISATCVQMAHDAHESHLKGALSCVDILVTLFSRILRYDPDHFQSPQRDRFIFSKGHAASALYATLAEFGIIPVETLKTYAQSMSPLPSHPCSHMLKALDWSSGSLGHGLGAGSGMAYGLKLRKSDSRVYVLMSDGECNEGSTWEAVQFAKANHLDNLIAVVDYNGSQSIGYTGDLMGSTNLADKFAAFGWTVSECDGHSHTELEMALNPDAFIKGNPSVVIARTNPAHYTDIIGDQILWHYRSPSKEEVERALSQLQTLPLGEDD